MTLADYQKAASKTFIGKFTREKETVLMLSRLILALNEESGEVAGVMKRIFRGDYSLEEGKENIKKELGDVLWYLATTCEAAGFSLEEVARVNLEKLADRQRRGKLQGSGDNR